MEYRIKLVEQFLDEFEEISDYISYKLKEIDVSKKLRKKVMENIYLLKKFPKMCSQIEKNG